MCQKSDQRPGVSESCLLAEEDRESLPSTSLSSLTPTCSGRSAPRTSHSPPPRSGAHAITSLLPAKPLTPARTLATTSGCELHPFPPSSSLTLLVAFALAVSPSSSSRQAPPSLTPCLAVSSAPSRQAPPLSPLPSFFGRALLPAARPPPPPPHCSASGPGKHLLILF